MANSFLTKPSDPDRIAEPTTKSPPGVGHRNYGVHVPSSFETTVPPPAAVEAIQDRALAHAEIRPEPIAAERVDIEGMDDPTIRAQMPVGIAAELTRYVEKRLRPGGFLVAMLIGDMTLAEQIATGPSRGYMPIVAYWIWRYAPSESFGCLTSVERWIEGVQ